MTDFNASSSKADPGNQPISSGNRHLFFNDELTKDQITLKSLLFDLGKNEIFGIFGPANSGKSTFLRFLDRILSLQMASVGLYQYSEDARECPVVGYAGIPGQENSATAEHSALEILISVVQPFDLSEPATRARLKQALRHLCQEGEIYSLPLSEASRAMIIKVGLLRALLDPPAYLLLDEPTEGLAPRCRDEVHTLIKDLRDMGSTTIILSTRDAGEAEELCDRITLLDQGRVLATGTTQALRHLVDQDTGTGMALSQLHTQLIGYTPSLVG